MSFDECYGAIVALLGAIPLTLVVGVMGAPYWMAPASMALACPGILLTYWLRNRGSAN